MKDLLRGVKKVTPEVWYAAVAFLFACMIWVSPTDDVLGKAIMVALIIALSLYHRIAGIIAVIAVIAIMKTTQKEGFSLHNPLIPTTPPITFASAAEFREKFCMKGVAQSGANISYEYILSPALFDDNNGKPQLKPEVIKQMNVPSLSAANSCKSDPPNSTNPNDYVTLSNICDPACKWTTVAPVPTPDATSAPTKEGFTPALRPHIRKARHAVSDGIDTLKSGARRLRRQLF